MLAFSRLAWVRVSNGSNRACGRNLAVLPCLWVLVCRLPRVKGLSAFLYTGLSRFLYGFRDLFAGLSAFFCVNADGSLAWLAPLGGYLVITAVIVT